jgi:hypothetical protein
MPVPIPLNECVILDERHLLWATIHSPYGPTRPCVGMIHCVRWQPLGEIACQGIALLADTGDEVARIVPFDLLNLTSDRARRLREDQARHEHRAARDSSYTNRWARRFREVSAAASASAQS